MSLALPTETMVLQGYTCTPLALDSDPIATILFDMEKQVGIIHTTCEVCIEQVLARNPSTYEPIIRLNETGILPEHEANGLEAGANHCAIF